MGFKGIIRQMMGKQKSIKVRMLNPHRGGPNMPQRAACPKCAHYSPRVSKTLGGANYRCGRCHEDFFVPVGVQNRPKVVTHE